MLADASITLPSLGRGIARGNLSMTIAPLSSLSLGTPDAHPFALAPPDVQKLRFANRVIGAPWQTRQSSDADVNR